MRWTAFALIALASSTWAEQSSAQASGVVMEHLWIDSTGVGAPPVTEATTSPP